MPASVLTLLQALLVQSAVHWDKPGWNSRDFSRTASLFQGSMSNSVTFYRIKEEVKCLQQHLVQKAERQDERSG